MSFRYTMKVPFYDVDAMRIVWHGNYVKYFEEARCAFFESLGLAYDEMERHGFLLPVVALTVKYVRPCVFGETVDIEVTPDYSNDNLLVLDYLVTDSGTGAKLVKASTKHAAVDRDSRQVLFQLPPEFVRRIREGESK
jgi:acyl-CoA thioester hydrolase